MQRFQKNMHDVRSSLGVKSKHWKVEQRSLQRIGHAMRMANDRPTKRAILGCLPALENTPRNRKKTRNTQQYWRRLVREAGIDPMELDHLTENRKTWRDIVDRRMEHLDNWENN